MSKIDDEMRAKLLKLKEELIAIAASSEASSAVVELDQSKVGRLSRMDAMQGQAMAQASNVRREATLRKIDAALKRLDDGGFGICRSCDEPINPKRLAFDPTSTQCVECAEAAEL